MEWVSFSPTPPADGFEDWELETADAVVRAFLRRLPTHTDGWSVDDLVQDCLLHWWLQRGNYDAGRGANRRTFMNRVCENRLRDIQRSAVAAKRRGARPDVSIDSERTPPAVVDPDVESDPESHAERSALREAIANVHSRLSPRQQAIADDLRRGFDVSAVSARSGVPRSTLYDELRRMRVIFRDEGLEEFLR